MTVTVKMVINDGWYAYANPVSRTRTWSPPKPSSKSLANRILMTWPSSTLNAT